MRIHLYSDERYPYYWAHNEEGKHGYMLELSEEDWKDYLRVDAEHEHWQVKFEAMCNAESDRRKLENARQSGRESLGFN